MAKNGPRIGMLRSVPSPRTSASLRWESRCRKLYEVGTTRCTVKCSLMLARNLGNG